MFVKKFLFVLLSVFSFSCAMAVVNLNTATPTELQTIKGIGAKKAQDIVDYRNLHGRFNSVDELDNVKGFGAKTIDKIRAELTVDGAMPVGGQKKSVADSNNKKRKVVRAVKSPIN